MRPYLMPQMNKINQWSESRYNIWEQEGAHFKLVAADVAENGRGFVVRLSRKLMAVIYQGLAMSLARWERFLLKTQTSHKV